MEVTIALKISVFQNGGRRSFIFIMIRDNQLDYILRHSCVAW